jgi:Kef-type K+ transport system membrane component KefB
MNTQDFVKLALQLTTMLGVAVLFGEILRRFRQPAVVGEMVGGILLGPTLFGWFAPSLYEWLFLSSANVTVVREAATKLGMLFFLFYAGLEVNLSDLKTLGKRAVLIGIIGTLLPIAAGVALVYAVPRAFWGPAVQEHFLSFALFIGMNLANSANPVIARILMELRLLDRPIGALIMSATIVDDLVNWTLFAIILGDIAPSSQAASGSLAVSALLVALLFVVLLGVGRWLGPAALRWVQPHVAWPSGFIAVTALFVLLASSASEALGVHAFLGAFLIGAALGEARDKHKHQDAHDVIGQFVTSFAPIFFVSMGMSANFITAFDPLLVTLILVVACVSKVGAVLIGAKTAGMSLDREVWAVAFGLNARGATGIILAGVGLANGVIDARLFVAVVFMAVITSLMAGPMMSRLLMHHEPVRAGRVRSGSDPGQTSV